MARPRNKDKNLINQSVEKACRVIQLFEEKTPELSMKEIAERFETTPTTILPILRSLEEAGYLRRDEETKKYRLGLRFLEIGNRVISGLNIQEEAKDILTDLSYAYSVNAHLGILDDSDIIYLFRICPVARSITDSYVGRRVPAHATALGKSILAFSDEITRNRFLKNCTWEKLTPKTISTATALKKEWLSIQKSGLALDDEENQAGCFCIAAPVFDYTGKPCGAVSVAISTVRITAKLKKTLSEEVRKAALKISERLGYKRTEETK